MGASSVTGTGHGSADKVTTNELSIMNNGPVIIFTGIVETILDEELSPQLGLATVSLPYALPGSGDNYVVMLTGMDSGYVYVSSKDEDDDGNFDSFVITSETEGTVMYMVSKVGVRPSVTL